MLRSQAASPRVLGLGCLLFLTLARGQVAEIPAAPIPLQMAALHGRVTDESGKGIGKAQVVVYNVFAGTRAFPLERVAHDTGVTPDCLTDPDGGFALPISAGTLCDIWIGRRGFATAFVRDVSPGAPPVDVKLGKGVPFSGLIRARDGEKLVPAPEETVRLSLAPREATWVGYTTEQRTDAEGGYTFLISAPPEGTVWVVSFAGKTVRVGFQDGELPAGVDFMVETVAARRPAQPEDGPRR